MILRNHFLYCKNNADVNIQINVQALIFNFSVILYLNCFVFQNFIDFIGRILKIIFILKMHFNSELFQRKTE